MRTTNRFLVCAAIAFLGTAVAASEGTGTAPTRAPSAGAAQNRDAALTIKAVGTVRDVMVGIIQPSSELVFAAASETPQTAEQWTALENGALTLAESANLLLIGGRERNEPEWIKWTSELREKSEGFLKATRAKDTAAIETANDEVYAACEGCHKVYVPGSV